MLWFTSIAAADPTGRLAPGPGELSTAQAELEGRLVVSEAVAVAVARLQGAHTNLPGKGPACDDPVRAQSLMRLRHFAERWRDTVQRSAVQGERLRWTASAPTVDPIVDEERRAVVAALLARSARLESQWLETYAWFLSSSTHACRDVSLSTFPGLRPPIIQAANEVELATAVTSLSGFVCPERAAPIEVAGDLVLLTGRACWSEDAECTCTPQQWWPGAVLGREPAPPPPDLAAVAPPVEEAADGTVPAEPVEEAGPGSPEETPTLDPVD